MFCTGVLLSLTTLTLCLSLGDLHVSLKSISPSVKSVEDIILTAVVSNPTTGDIRVIAKNNVLDGSAISFFAVSNNSVLFMEDRLYANIPAGLPVAASHTGLAPLYDFEKIA
ncbi:hypothetical protein DFH08DRAFT_985503 [Mycena albidolilacea]|uniref:Uncharacterized protein n=1 Tax=Mycena albidolilacea TaxID=1033008 RepID=A0AAD7ADH1_9AGAR|nr:hypothetical protein DFH08DRAFT_985503 [Mycena albidolilacea]